VTRNTMSAAEKNEDIVQGTNSDLGSSRYIPTAFAFAESFGGGSECMPFWGPLWPSSSIRLFDQEED
jgi:hypothetical protein